MFLKIWNASRICVSSLRRGHANLLCIVPILVYVLPKRARSFVSLGRYTPKYFILFIAMVNGIVSLISLSVFSLLVYRNARDFCVLIL